MAEFVITAPAVHAVPVQGGGTFPIRRVFCVGRNYAAHAREMGADPDREPPFFFTKPNDAVTAAHEVPYPTATVNLHYEMELVVAIGMPGVDIAGTDALKHVYGYAAGVDLTRRDLQDEAKALRRPWDMSKGFDNSAPIGPIVPAAKIGHPNRGRIMLSVDGETRQDGDLADMIWPVSEIIAFLSHLVALQPGDLIYSGTPEGVGAAKRGSTIIGFIAGVGELTFKLT